jgi:arylsulfatase A-like enzyme
MNAIHSNLKCCLLGCGAVALVAGLATGCLAASSDESDRPYNVLMIIIDDAAPQLHSVGQGDPVRTPNIERIASRGTWFTRAYCNAPACNPSRTAMLTGVKASRSGVYYNSQKFPENWIAEAESMIARFRNAGYLTAGYGKIAHTMKASMPDYTPGFVMPHNSSGHVTHTDTDLLEHIIPGTLRAGGSGNFTWGNLTDEWDRNDPKKWQQDTQQANRAIELLAKEQDRPFFLAIGFWRPHVRFTVPNRFFDMHPLNQIEVPAGYHPFDLEDLPSRGLLMSWSDRHHVDIVKRGLWKRGIQGYFAAMSYVDEQIGRVLDALEASGHADDTIVVFLSDNGMHLGEKNHWLKYTLWEQATRVFLSVYVPGYPKQTIDSPVSLVDLYPTLATLSGIGPPKHELDGVDLTSLLAGKVRERHRPVLSTWGRGNHAVRDVRYRYIRYRNGEEELYDHLVDEHEWHNLANDPQFASVKARLAAYLPESDAPNTKRLNPPQSELEWDEATFK